MPNKVEDWMITAAYDIAHQLPTDHAEALTVLGLVHEMVDKINKPHSAKPQRRRPRKAAGK
jgi:hypothetical protein